MAHVVILQHPSQRGLPLPYLIQPLAERWRARGHRVTVHHGARGAPPGDLAVLHVDLTVVPEPMRAALARYPRVVNGALLDISKRRISRQLLRPDSAWGGEVIVKTDANSGADPERRLHRLAERRGIALPPPPARGYRVYESVAAVPDEAWRTPGLVVEKFLPEREGPEYCLRVWTFFGDRERCRRCRSAEPIVKSRGVTGHEPCDVPDELRRRRAELGCDYGKFDFVVHEGACVLLDVNRTPVHPAHVDVERGPVPELERGLDVFLRPAAGSAIA